MKLLLGKARKQELISSEEASKLIENGVIELNNNNLEEVSEILDRDIDLTEVKSDSNKDDSKTKNDKGDERTMLEDMYEKGVINHGQLRNLERFETNNLADVKNIGGIGPKTIKKIKDYLLEYRNNKKDQYVKSTEHVKVTKDKTVYVKLTHLDEKDRTAHKWVANYAKIEVSRHPDEKCFISLVGVMDGKNKEVIYRLLENGIPHTTRNFGSSLAKVHINLALKAYEIYEDEIKS